MGMMTAFLDRFQRPASKDDTFSATSGNFSLFRMASAVANKARDRVMVSFAPAIISTKSARMRNLSLRMTAALLQSIG
jgi:hypothetical protein